MIRTFFSYIFIALLVFSPAKLSAPKKNDASRRGAAAPTRSQIAPSPREQMDQLFRELNNVVPVTPIISLEADEDATQDATQMVVFMQQLTNKTGGFFEQMKKEWELHSKNPFNFDPFTIGFIHGISDRGYPSTKGLMTSFNATAMRLNNKEIITLSESLNLIAFFEGFSLAMREISDMVVIHPDLNRATSHNFQLGFQTFLNKKSAPTKYSLVYLAKKEGSLPLLVNVALTRGYEIAAELLTVTTKELASTGKDEAVEATAMHCGAGSGTERTDAAEYTPADVASPSEPVTQTIAAPTPEEPEIPSGTFLSGFCNQVLSCKMNPSKTPSNYAKLLVQYQDLISTYPKLSTSAQTDALRELSIIDGMLEAILNYRQFEKSSLNCDDGNQALMQMSFEAGSTATLDDLIANLATIDEKADLAYFRGAAVAQDISNAGRETPVLNRTTTAFLLSTLKESSVKRKPTTARSKTRTVSTAAAIESNVAREALAETLCDAEKTEQQLILAELAKQAEKRRLDLEKSKAGMRRAAEREAKKADQRAKDAKRKKLADQQAANELELARIKAAQEKRLAKAAEEERIAARRAEKAAKKIAQDKQAQANKETHDYDAAFIAAEEQKKLAAFQTQVLEAKKQAKIKEDEGQARKAELAQRAHEAAMTAEAARKAAAEIVAASSPRSSDSEGGSTLPSSAGSFASSTTGPETPRVVLIPTMNPYQQNGRDEAFLIFPKVNVSLTTLITEAKEKIRYLQLWIMYPGNSSELEYWRGRLAGYEQIEKEQMKDFKKGVTHGLKAFRKHNKTYKAVIKRELETLSGTPKTLETILRYFYLQGFIAGYKDEKLRAYLKNLNTA